MMQKSKENVKSLSASVEERIIRMITENEMKPGDKLENEYQLAQRLGVGRGTVREAIKALASRNVLVVRQGSGTFVSPGQGVSNDPLGLTFAKQDRQLALDLLDVRLILEPEIAALAAIRADEEEMVLMQKKCDKVQHLIETGQDYGKEDVALHRLIAHASHNQVVSILVPVLHSSAGLNIDLTRNELKENTMRYHRELVERICQRDAPGARYAMILHLAENRRYIRSTPQREKD